MRHRDLALQAQRNSRPVEAPLEVGGTRLCLDCHDPIDPRRIAAYPQAVRCAECQHYHDKEAKR